MEAKIYNQEGKEAGSLKLPENIFGVKWNSDLVHQTVTSMKSNARQNIAHTKTRGEVAGGGKKPWRQKGTGRARHGSTRSPIWVGGGIAHGPRNDKDYGRKINRKMKAKALFTVLSKKYKDGEILFINELKLSEAKAKSALAVLKNLSGISGFKYLLSKKNNSAYIATGSKEKAVERSFGNFGNLSINEARNMNPVDIMDYKYVVFVNPEEAIKILSAKV
jgi:large subunit ribosomal protein L4